MHGVPLEGGGMLCYVLLEQPIPNDHTNGKLRKRVDEALPSAILLEKHKPGAA